MDLFKNGNFVSRSGVNLSFKIECDALTDNDIKCIADFIASKIEFYDVYGIPSGGTRLEMALEKHKTKSDIFLIVDDVLTTGKSMEFEKNKRFDKKVIGWVIFARSKPHHWINSMFQLYGSG